MKRSTFAILIAPGFVAYGALIFIACGSSDSSSGDGGARGDAGGREAASDGNSGGDGDDGVKNDAASDSGQCVNQEIERDADTLGCTVNTAYQCGADSYRIDCSCLNGTGKCDCMKNGVFFDTVPYEYMDMTMDLCFQISSGNPPYYCPQTFAYEAAECLFPYSGVPLDGG